MSTLDETTPLISNSVPNDASLSHLGDRVPANDVQDRCQAILDALSAHSDGPISSGSEPDNLIVLLYASRHLNVYLKETLFVAGESTIASHLVRERLEHRIRQRLNTEIGAILDEWGRGDVDDQTLYEGLWRRWRVGTERVSAIDLMITGDDGRSNRYLSYPVIIHLVQHLYQHGPACTTDNKGILGNLEMSITPRRAHILHFISYTSLWFLTIISAMRPDTWATRTSPRIPTHSPLEIIWLIFTSAAVIQVLQHPRRFRKHLFLLPSALSLITCWTSYGFTFLTLSIPALTISLLRPEPPSIPFLIPSLLPHSIRLWDIVLAGFTGWALIWPIVVVLFILFSISLNGDIFRGLFVISTSGSDTPVEEGIAPYETRVAIFATILILVYLAICLSISNVRNSRASRSNGDESEEVTRARGVIVSGSRWLLGDLGQQNRLQDYASENDRMGAVNTSPPPVPLPFNLISVPLDLLGIALHITRFSSREKNEGAFGKTVRRISYLVAILMVGIPCWVLSFVV